MRLACAAGTRCQNDGVVNRLAPIVRWDGKQVCSELCKTRVRLKAGDREDCTCHQRRKDHKMVCRCTCDDCGSRNLQWKSWGVYLDKDLICQDCGHEQDDWDC